MVANKFICIAFIAVLLFAGCASERQGLVCEEIEYRLSTMTYSPDQRAYLENELNTCREEEAKKKGEAGQSNTSIYERYANMGATAPVDTSKEIPVSTLLQDSSEEQTMSIYDRYKSVGTDSSAGADK
ncbi:MAG: hypothetical protein J6W51_03260 [Fibrobacter sp.]|nr:hypothetical protein [Fibrobacter sp.]